MFKLTLTGGQVAAISLVAIALRRARQALETKGLLDADDEDVQEHDQAVEECVVFAENMFPLFKIETPEEQDEATLEVDAHCLSCLIRVLQKTAEEARPILDKESETIQATQDAGDLEGALKLVVSYLENCHFYIILHRALDAVIATMTGPVPTTH